MPGKNCIDDLGHNRIVIPDDSREQRLMPLQLTDQVVAKLIFDTAMAKGLPVSSVTLWETLGYSVEEQESVITCSTESCSCRGRPLLDRDPTSPDGSFTIFAFTRAA